MTRYGLAALSMLLLAAGCAPRSTEPSPAPPGPATSELARLYAAGEIAPERMTCVIPATVSLAEGARARTRVMREARADAAAATARDHARSVQQGMFAADVQVAAAEAAQANQRTVEHFRSTGQLTRAATQSSYGMSIAAYARERGEIWVDGGGAGRLSSDEDAALLVEYAQLRADRAASPGEALGAASRLSVIEADKPSVVNEYAALLMDLYFDPDLPCEVGAN